MRTPAFLLPDDYTEAPHGVACARCHGSGFVDLGDGPYGRPQVYECSTCYGTGRVPEPEDMPKPGTISHQPFNPDLCLGQSL